MRGNEVGNTLDETAPMARPLRTALFFPFTAEHDLKVRDGRTADLAANSVEPEIADVMLPAELKQPLILMVKTAHRFVHFMLLRARRTPLTGPNT
jgi:hypothetical protein